MPNLRLQIMHVSSHSYFSAVIFNESKNSFLWLDLQVYNKEQGITLLCTNYVTQIISQKKQREFAISFYNLTFFPVFTLIVLETAGTGSIQHSLQYQHVLFLLGLSTVCSILTLLNMHRCVPLHKHPVCFGNSCHLFL